MVTQNHFERAPLYAAGRKACLFCISERGDHGAAVLHPMIQTECLIDVGPDALLAAVLSRIADRPLSKLPGGLPGNWCSPQAWCPFFKRLHIQTRL